MPAEDGARARRPRQLDPVTHHLFSLARQQYHDRFHSRLLRTATFLVVKLKLVPTVFTGLSGVCQGRDSTTSELTQPTHDAAFSTLDTRPRPYFAATHLDLTAPVPTARITLRRPGAINYHFATTRATFPLSPLSPFLQTPGPALTGFPSSIRSPSCVLPPDRARALAANARGHGGAARPIPHRQTMSFAAPTSNAASANTSTPPYSWDFPSLITRGRRRGSSTPTPV